MIAIVIPTLDPGENLISFVKELASSGAENIVVLDDGSRAACGVIFSELEKIPCCTVLHHAVNLGKGRALKDSFNYLLTAEPELCGAVTADSDGQHSVQDVMKVLDRLRQEPEKLILGVRDFSTDDVPWKSRFGNRSSRLMFRLLAGVDVSDTQTGLRGIPSSFMKELLDAPGERFDFESTMLILSRRSHISISELKIETIYLDGNRETHFHPLLDSWQISKVLFAPPLKSFFLFCCSALLAAAVDLGVFALLYKLLLPGKLLIAVAAARIFSSLCNYLVNRDMVFGGRQENKFIQWRSLLQYYLLCVFILGGSYFLTKAALNCRIPLDAVVIKAIIDTMLFIVSFFVQKLLIFRKKTA